MSQRITILIEEGEDPVKATKEVVRLLSEGFNQGVTPSWTLEDTHIGNCGNCGRPASHAVGDIHRCDRCD